MATLPVEVTGGLALLLWMLTAAAGEYGLIVPSQVRPYRLCCLAVLAFGLSIAAVVQIANR